MRIDFYIMQRSVNRNYTLQLQTHVPFRYETFLNNRSNYTTGQLKATSETKAANHVGG